MSEMTLFDYYSLDEAVNRKEVISILKSLKKEGKINYELEMDIFKIEDIDLDESELSELLDLFSDNDVFPYLERDEFEDEDDYYDDEDENW
jgi:hypothetical protein